MNKMKKVTLGTINLLGIDFWYKGSETLPRQRYFSWFENEAKDKQNVTGCDGKNYLVDKNIPVLVIRQRVYSEKTIYLDREREEKLKKYKEKVLKRKRR